MKLLLGILIALVVVSVSVAVYSEVQRREDAKQIAKLEKKVDAIDDEVGSSGGGFGSSTSGFGSGGFGGDASLTDRVDLLCSNVSSANC